MPFLYPSHALYSSKPHGTVLNKLDSRIAWPTINSSSKKAKSVGAKFPSLAINISPITSNFISFFPSLFTRINKQKYPPWVDPNIVLKGNYAPVEETPPTECLVEGELSPSLNGVYIRNGPNPQYHPCGPHHLFEGDGMLHSVKLSNGRAIFCSRYVRTYKYKLEHEAGRPMIRNIFSGFYCLGDVGWLANCVGNVLLGRINPFQGIGTANTSIGVLFGRVFALMEADLPYEIELTEKGDINTKGRFDFNGKAPVNITAHPKIDDKSGKILAFQCFPIFPYLSLICFDDYGLKEHIPIFSLKHPSYVHDFAITENCIVFPDIQLEMEVKKLFLCKGMPLESRPTKIPRIGIISRDASSDTEMRWFNVPDFNALHILNAWEDNDTLVIIASNLLSPEQFLKNLGSAHFSLEKLRINLKSGTISRTSLSEKSLELGSINPNFQGKKNRYVYMGITEGVIRMSGVVKIDLELECEVARRSYGSDCFGGEALFIAKRDKNRKQRYDEDDGFILSYIHNERTNESVCLVMNARSPTLDVVATVRLPVRVPYGFHGHFVMDV